MITKKYTKTKMCEAVKITPENIHEVAKWCEGSVSPYPNNRSIRFYADCLLDDEGQYQYADVGDYMCRSDRQFFAQDRGTFEFEWKEIQ